jgi:hypothetical protein
MGSHTAITRGSTVSTATALRALAALAGLSAACAAPACNVETHQGRHRLVEDFRWSGNHAATIANGAATTVWWDEDCFDARGDSTYISVQSPIHDDGIDMANTFHVDIHKAASADPRDGRIDNSTYAVNGDGAPGVGIMHQDYQDIASVRVRNPLLIAPGGAPAVVEFHASLYDNTGHWKEIAFTPVDGIVGAEHSSVPTVDDPLPFAGTDVGQPGPGHLTLADSINLVSIGTADYPCDGFPGWRTRFAVTKTIGGARTHYVNSAGQGDYLQTHPDQRDTLVLWRVELRPDLVALSLDLDGDGVPTLVETWAVDIPWQEVHVHLVSVAYQSSHHPPTCNPGFSPRHLRELQWRRLRMDPVKYARTAVFPKNEGTLQHPKTLGFMQHDLRDIQRFDPPVVAGVPQPNASGYAYRNRGKYCNDGGDPCFGGSAAPPPLAFTLPPRTTDDLLAVNLLADLHDAAPAALHPSLRSALNGTAVGRFPAHDDVLDAPGLWADWVRRALPVTPALLQPGSNTLELTLETGTYVDRLEFELMYGAASATLDRVFADGFEVASAIAKSLPANYRHPALGQLEFAGPLFAPVAHRCSDP